MTKEKNNLDFNQVGHEGSVKFDIKSFKDRSRGSLKTIFTHMFPNGKIRGNEFVVGDLNGAPGDSCSFNLDKDGFPLNEDGSAMTLNEKINLVTDPDLEVLAENIFDNRKKVVDQIRQFNTKLPFGDNTPTKRRIRPDEVEDTINRMKTVMRLNSQGFGQDRYDKTGFQDYLANLRRQYSNAG